MIAIVSAYKNVIAIGALIALGGLIVTGIYTAGIRHEQRKWALEMASRNAPILEQRGKDEAELAAGAEAAKAVDTAVAAGVTQSCILTPQSAKLLAEVR
jgi:hypothetical protein